MQHIKETFISVTWTEGMTTFLNVIINLYLMILIELQYYSLSVQICVAFS